MDVEILLEYMFVAYKLVALYVAAVTLLIFKLHALKFIAFTFEDCMVEFIMAVNVAFDAVILEVVKLLEVIMGITAFDALKVLVLNVFFTIKLDVSQFDPMPVVKVADNTAKFDKLQFDPVPLTRTTFELVIFDALKMGIIAFDVVKNIKKAFDDVAFSTCKLDIDMLEPTSDVNFALVPVTFDDVIFERVAFELHILELY